MKKPAYFIAAILSALLLCSCARGAEELPEDNPANHWESPIMETDKGYFSNRGYMYLRYYEKIRTMSFSSAQDPNVCITAETAVLPLTKD